LKKQPLTGHSGRLFFFVFLIFSLFFPYFFQSFPA